ncbi:hypothetical protein Bbelb_098240 [Branchiostoma belcheri]|nr:hypothetical protein Bbelb_098240 [Branchiostoma belcheri]
MAVSHTAHVHPGISGTEKTESGLDNAMCNHGNRLQGQRRGGLCDGGKTKHNWVRGQARPTCVPAESRWDASTAAVTTPSYTTELDPARLNMTEKKQIKYPKASERDYVHQVSVKSAPFISMAPVDCAVGPFSRRHNMLRTGPPRILIGTVSTNTRRLSCRVIVVKTSKRSEKNNKRIRGATMRTPNAEHRSVLAEGRFFLFLFGGVRQVSPRRSESRACADVNPTLLKVSPTCWTLSAAQRADTYTPSGGQPNCKTNCKS